MAVQGDPSPRVAGQGGAGCPTEAESGIAPYQRGPTLPVDVVNSSLAQQQHTSEKLYNTSWEINQIEIKHRIGIGYIHCALDRPFLSNAM